MSTSTTSRREPHDITTSGTAYHSFDDMEPYEPSSPGASPRTREDSFGPGKFTRHDSGYESAYTEPKSLHDRSRRSVSKARRQKRPVGTQHHKQQRVHSPNSHFMMASQQQQQQQQRHHHKANSFFYFPSLDGRAEPETHDEPEAEPTYLPPPQTVYWMSDSTRRMEYAAIDSASRGVKGWFVKHVIPSCLVPKDLRRLTFDDDTGSVRRYRLDLDDEGGKSGRKLGWLFGKDP